MAGRTQLDVTHDFIDLFEYAAGEWTTPGHFLRWAAMGLIAACVEDRVSMPFDATTDTFPNLWIALIGVPATGKDYAVRHALKLIQPEDRIWLINGKTSIPALYDYMHARQKAAQTDSAPVWLIASDVTQLLPPGTEALDFTTRALALYDRQDHITDMTRTNGTKVIHRPLLNWVLGCTPGWFHVAITPLSFTNGYATRMCFIFGEPNLANLHLRRPVERHDGDLVREYLRRRVEQYQNLPQTTVSLTAQAEAIFDGWYALQKQVALEAHRVDTDRESLGRIRMLASKLAMNLALSQWEEGRLLVVTGDIASRAISLTMETYEGVKRVADFAHINTDTQMLEIARNELRQQPKLRLKGRGDSFLKRLSKRGLPDLKKFDAIVELLKQTGEAKVWRERPTGPGGPWPTYIGPVTRKMLLSDEAEPVVVTEPTDEEESNGTEEV